MSVSGRMEESQETRSIKYSRNPVYEQSFVLLVNNPEVDDFYVKVYDERSKATLGQLRLNLADLVKREGMEYFNQPFKLKNNGTDSTVTLHLQLFFTKKTSVGWKRPSVSIDLDDDNDEDFSSKKLSVISGKSVDLEEKCSAPQTSLTLNENIGEGGTII